MSQWGSSDAASNSVIWAPANKKQAPTRTNANLMYGNTTSNAYGDGQIVSMLAVDKTESGVGAGGIIRININNAGTGYTGNTTVTISGGGGADGAANAQANVSTGKIISVNISNTGSSYETNPTVVIAAPAAITFNANTALYKDATFNALTGVANTTEIITTSSAHGFKDGDLVQYRVAAGNTAITGLADATSYYITNSNTTAFTVSSASGGANVGLTAGVSETGHTLRRVGQGYITLSNAPFQVNDSFTYAAAAGNTSLTGLTSGTSYFISTVNTSAISLSTTPGGAAVVLTPGVSETGHSITGVTATGTAVVGGATNKGVAHTGWVVRTEGTGGRAGRVQYEVLVAGGIVTDNNNDDATLPDA